jgi:hypothetical protein
VGCSDIASMFCSLNQQLLSLLLFCGVFLAQARAGDLSQVDFNRDIRPILSDHCYQCHGPDENARVNELRFDKKDSAFGDIGGYAPFVVGDVANSEALRRINSEDPAERMPPPEAKIDLSDRERLLLQKWVEQGAEWQDHWAFEPPRQHESPRNTASDPWCKNKIDTFIKVRLDEEGLKPSARADRLVLLRRAYLDLTGLPPSPEEVEAFADNRPDAYERVVDKLLASDACAERLTMEWLDLSRYADSHGLHADGERNSWPWRDWVIKAFAQNMKYDEFVTWQLAGDLLPHPSQDQILATAFLRNHPMTGEGGVIDEEARWNNVFDRVETVSTSMLGLTMKCSRCHDHKFDPLKQSEYYQLAAFFNNVRELGMTGDDGDYGPLLYLTDPVAKLRLAELDETLKAADAKLVRLREQARESQIGSEVPQVSPPEPLWHQPFDELVDGKPVEKGETPKWLDGKEGAVAKLPPEFVDGIKHKAASIAGEFGSIDISGLRHFDVPDPFSAAIWVKPKPHMKGKPKKSRLLLGNAGHKNEKWRGWEFFIDLDDRLALTFVHGLPQDRILVRSVGPITNDQWSHVAFAYGGTGQADSIALYLNGQPLEVQVIDDELVRTMLPVTGSATVDDERPLSVGRSRRQFEGDFGIYDGALDELFLWDKELTAFEIGKLYNGYGHGNPVKPSAQQQFEHLLARHNDAFIATAANRRALLATRVSVLSEAPAVMVMREMPEPRETHLLKRGAYDQPGETVRPNVPLIVGKLTDSDRKDRLGLARWLFSEDNPLTARVTVNRYWQMLMGQGLVGTAHDFGLQGDYPTHPELLDDLAVRFRKSGWDVRWLLREIVTSAAYQQSSKIVGVEAEAATLNDPKNRLLWRSNSSRLPFEMIRDCALVAAELLEDKVGGPSVKPYQPPGLWEEKSSFSQALLTYVQDHGEKLYRRGMYTFIRRTSPPPSMTIFDAPNRSECLVRREVTNTPLQALVLLNDPQYIEASRVLAQKLLTKETGIDDCINEAFLRLTSRPATSEESKVLRDLFERMTARFERDNSAATKLLAVGEYKSVELDDDSRNELAALTVVTNTIMNYDAFYMRR